jgi:hypothetical protein
LSDAITGGGGSYRIGFNERNVHGAG